MIITALSTFGYSDPTENISVPRLFRFLRLFRFVRFFRFSGFSSFPGFPLFPVLLISPVHTNGQEPGVKCKYFPSAFNIRYFPYIVNYNLKILPYSIIPKPQASLWRRTQRVFSRYILLCFKLNPTFETLSTFPFTYEQYERVNQEICRRQNRLRPTPGKMK